MKIFWRNPSFRFRNSLNSVERIAITSLSAHNKAVHHSKDQKNTKLSTVLRVLQGAQNQALYKNLISTPQAIRMFWFHLQHNFFA